MIGSHRSRDTFGFPALSLLVLLAAVLSSPAARAAADLEITFTITPQDANVGATVTYALRIKNLGPDATQSSQFTITTQLNPDIFMPESIVSTSGTCTLGAAGENYRCVYPRFQPNDEVQVTIVGKAVAVGTRTFFAGFTPADDPVPGNNFRNARLTVQDPAFCTGCLVGTVGCQERVMRRLDADCLLDNVFTDIWEFELDRAGTVSIDLRMPLSSQPGLRVRDSACRDIAPGPCRFDTGGVICPFTLQAGKHFILAGARSAGADYELAVECGGVRDISARPNPAGGVAVSWKNSPISNPAAPISVRVNGAVRAMPPGIATQVVLPPAALGQPPDGVAEICVVDSSGRPACAGVFLGDDLAVNCGGPRLDQAQGSGVGDGRVWLEDTVAKPNPFLRSPKSATVDFTTDPRGFTTADLRLVGPNFGDDPQRSRLFATARTATDALTYRFGVKPGLWELTLLFAEGCCSEGCLAVPDPGESPGPCRVFEVLLDGETVDGRFSPHVAAQLALRNQLPNAGYGVALAAAPLRVEAAGEIDITLRDLGAGDPPGDPLLNGILLRRVRPARFELGLADASCGLSFEGPAGTVFRTTIECALTTSANPFSSGPRGWSLSLGVEGGAIRKVTTDGTVGAEVTANPPGFRQGGFELSELTSGPGNDGAVTTVALSQDGSVTLPREGRAVIAKLEVEGVFPPAGCSRRVTLYYADGRSGDRGPIANLIQQLDLSARPSLGQCSFDLNGTAAVPLRRGDVNDDGLTNITDAIGILFHLFVLDFPLTCRDVADIDDDGQVVITDAIGLLVYLFLNGQSPAVPFETCGGDPTADDLACASHAPCPPVPPDPGGCPPPVLGPILARAAPEPFELPLLKGISVRSRLAVRNPRSRSVRVETIAIDPRFDDELFALSGLPALPATLRAGESLGVDLAGSSLRLGLHRVDVRYRTDLGEHVEEVTFDVAARGARPRIPEEILILTLPGQSAEEALLVANTAEAREDLVVVLDGPSQVGPFSVDPATFPIAVEPGGAIPLPVRLGFDGAAPGAFGQVFTAELRLRSNGGPSDDGLPGIIHRIQLTGRVAEGARFSGPLTIALGNDLTRTLLAEEPFRTAHFTVRTADPRFVRLRGAGGGLVDEVRGVRHGDAVTFTGMGPGAADIVIAIEPPAGGGILGGLVPLRLLGAGVQRAASSAGTRVVRLLDGGAARPDTIEFVDLPGGAVARRHELPGDAILRGSDFVPVEVADRTLGLFQIRSGETKIYDLADGSEKATVRSPGAPAVPGVDPVTARITLAGRERVFGISVDSQASLVSYDIETGAVSGAVSLTDSSPSPTLAIGEDVDPLVHGQDGTAVPPAVFVMALNGECFAAPLPTLAPVTALGKLNAGVRIAVDPVAHGPTLVSFQDAAGEVLFVDRTGGGIRTYRRLPRVESTGEGTVLFDAPLPEVDIVSTRDGRFAVQLAAYGHARVLDREKIDPLGAQTGQPLVTLRAPFQALSLVGVDPIIARYDAASPTRERDARVICAYDRDVVRIFSLDGSLQFTYEPLATGAEGWKRNIDILLGPPGAGGLEEHAILRYGNGEIRVVELATGRLLQTIVDPDRGRPVEGVDPRLTPDGRFLIDLSVDTDLTTAVVRIHGVHPETFGQIREVEGDLALPERDVDLILHESGQWAALLDRAGGITAFDLQGKLLGGAAAPAFARSILDVDLGIARQAALTPDPDEDWVEPPAGTEPAPNPPPIVPPTPGPGTPVPPDGDPVPRNPDDDKEEGGGGCVIPGGYVCVCDGHLFNLNSLFDRIPELNTCPIGFVGSPSGKTSKVEIKSQSPLEQCSTRKLQAIRFQGRLLPLDEVHLSPPEDCPVPNCGCDEQHWHALNGFDALATDGTRVRDPNPSGCGYGTISEVEIVDLGEKTDCSGRVVSVEGPLLTARAPGTSVIHIRPCVAPNISAADLAKVKPIEVEIVVIRPRKLTAELLAKPGTMRMVDKSSKKPQCLVAACGDPVDLTGESCPSICIEHLEIAPPPGGTTTGPCEFIFRSFNGPGGRETVSFTAPNECRVHPAYLKCKTPPTHELPPINIHVIDIETVEAPKPPVLTQGDAYFFKMELCPLSKECESSECDRNDLRAQLEAVADRAEFFLVEPNGTEVPLGPLSRATSFKEPDENTLVVEPLVTAPDFPGQGYKFRAKLGACMKDSGPFDVTFRSVIDAIPSPEQPDPRNQKTKGEPVFVHSGEYVYHALDLAVPGRGLSFLWERIHRSQATYGGPLGNNWDFNYNERLVFVDQDGDGDLDVRHSSMLYVTTYLRTGNGPLDYLTPDGHYKRLRRNADGSFSLRYREGEVRTFHGPGAPLGGRLKEIADRTGENRLRFEYDGQGQLVRILDTYNRLYTIEYTRGRITKLRDFGGREVVYGYFGPGDAEGSDGDLRSSRSPVVTGTPNWNDFPQGKTTRYTYLAGPVPSELRSNLLTITMPNEVARGGPPSLINVYGMDPDDTLTFDRVITQVEGGVNHSGVPAGGTYQYYYEDLNPGANPADLTIPRRRTVTVDRNGNVESMLFNARFQLIEERTYTGRVSPTLRFPYAIESRGPGLRSGFVAAEGRPGPDPDFYSHRFEFNRHGETIRIVFPEGNIQELVYGFENDPNPLVRGDKTEERWVADPDRLPPGPGGTTVRRRTFTYEPLTNGAASIVEYRGNEPAHDGPDADQDPDGPGRYRTSWLFDYQEVADTQRVRNEAAAWGITIPADFSLGLGDLNGDGQEGPLYGQAVKEIRPVATVSRWDGGALGFATPQQASARTRYNRYGQTVAEVDLEENVTRYVYYPATDPDGDGQALISGNDAVTGGYLRSHLRDTTSSPGRNSGRNPAPENRARHFGYNRNGYLTEVIDGRGVVTAMVRNQLDQIVRTIQAESIDPAVRGEARPEESLAAPLGYVEDIFSDHNGNVVRIQTENRDSGTATRNPTFDVDMEYDIQKKLVRRSVEVDEATRAVWQYRYDPNENQILLHKPEGNEESAVYDERGLILSITNGANDPLVASTKTQFYDGNGNLRFTIDGEDTDGDGLLEVTESLYDGWDRQRRVIDPAGQEVLTDYDVANDPIRRRVLGSIGGPTPSRGDGASLTLLEDVRSTFDERGRRVRVDRMLLGPFSPGLETIEGPLTPDGGDVSTVFEFDRLSRVVRVVDDRGNDSLRGYNGLGEVAVRETAPVNGKRNTLRVSRDRAGNPSRRLETEVLPDGSTRDFETVLLHDALNRVARGTDPIGQTSYFAYDSRGHRTLVSDAKGPLIGADPTQATALAINGTGNTSRAITDGLGRLTARFTDLRAGGAGNGVPSLAVPPDPSAAPEEIEETAANPDGVISEGWTYDLNSRLLAYRDDRGNTTSFSYDALDRLIEQQHADGTRWTFRYDRDGNLTSSSDPRGVVTRFTYDALERHVRTDIDRAAAPAVAGTLSIVRELDGLGRLTQVADGNDPADAGDDHVVEWAYDSLGNPLREVQDGLTVERQWDGVGNKTSTVYPGGARTLSAGYDPLDRCETLALEGAPSLEICRTEYAGPSVRRTREVLGNGLQTLYRYDSKRRLLSVETGSGAGVVTGRAYAYDRGDNRVSERWLERSAEGGQEGRSYSVDSQYRVTAARPSVLDSNETVVSTAPPEESFRWVLDGAANWVEYQAPGKVRAGTFNVLNQDAAYLHDEAGNRASDGRRRHVFDGLNRLLEVRDVASGALLESYTYDALSRRATRTVFSPDGSRTTTRFIHDGEHVIEERMGGEVRARNYYLPQMVDALVARESSAGLTWRHADVVNSTTAVTDATGRAVEFYEYTPFGEVRFLGPALQPLVDGAGRPLRESSIGNPYLFIGRRLDGSGLYYVRNRYLDPEDGRFLSRDSGFDALNTGNLYAYAGLNPLAYLDPWGAAGQPAREYGFDINRSIEAGKGLAEGARDFFYDVAWFAFLPQRLVLDPRQTASDVADFWMGTAGGIKAFFEDPAGVYMDSVRRSGAMTDRAWCRGLSYTGLALAPIPTPGTMIAAAATNRIANAVARAVRSSATMTVARATTSITRAAASGAIAHAPGPKPAAGGIQLYHGTRAPPDAFRGGIDVNVGGGQLGPGFYVSPGRGHALWYAAVWRNQGGAMNLVKITIPENALGGLKIADLAADSPEFLRLTHAWEKGLPVPDDLRHLIDDFDAIRAPVFMEGMAPGVQIKFNPRAQDFLNQFGLEFETPF